MTKGGGRGGRGGGRVYQAESAEENCVVSLHVCVYVGGRCGWSFVRFCVACLCVFDCLLSPGPLADGERGGSLEMFCVRVCVCLPELV